ncbi:MAG: S41 family peptidase [Deinococcales bacterium]
MKRRWLIIGLVALGLTTAVVNAQLSHDFAGELLNNPSGRALVQVFGALKTGYLHDVKNQDLIRGAIHGMVGSLNDPFTTYIEPKAAAFDNQQMTGQYEGIGAVLYPHDRQTGKGVEILTVYQGGPADKAGIRRGDIFLKVDGVDVSNKTSSEVADLVRGPKGTTVHLTMRRPGQDTPLEFSIVRSTIKVVDVSSTMLPNHVGYVALSSFENQKLNDQLTQQVDALKKEGATSLILDLRDNPGGLLTEAIDVSDDFLSHGDIVFQRARGVTQRLASADPQQLFSGPMVVLVNHNSASASEIVSAALQDNHRAKVVGEQTFGKGVAQSVVSLSDGGQLRYVSFEWLTPDRTNIQKKGITPDIKAVDTRYPRTITVDGSGAEPGQTVQIVVGGKTVGTTTAGSDGSFQFVTLGPRPQVSGVQGKALVSLSDDHALKVAYDTVLKEVQAGTAAKASH